MNKTYKMIEITEVEEDLIFLRDSIYGGKWSRMVNDLTERVKIRPYVWQLINRIENDLDLIKALRRRLGE